MLGHSEDSGERRTDSSAILVLTTSLSHCLLTHQAKELDECP